MSSSIRVLGGGGGGDGVFVADGCVLVCVVVFEGFDIVILDVVFVVIVVLVFVVLLRAA